MTYPEGTRLVVWNHDGDVGRGVVLDNYRLCWDARSAIPEGHIAISVRESAAKCAERMLEALHNVLPLLEQGATAIPEDDEVFGFYDYEDAIAEIKALIAEAEGKDAK